MLAMIGLLLTTGLQVVPRQRTDGVSRGITEGRCVLFPQQFTEGLTAGALTH